MFKKRWYPGAKGFKKKEKKSSDVEGDFGGQFLAEKDEFDSGNVQMPPAVFKGAHSITFQLSGPGTFAIIGRNQKIRSELKQLVGSRLDEESGAYEFDLARREGVKSALIRLGYDVNDIPLEVLRTMDRAVEREKQFEEVNLSLMPMMLMEALLPFQRTGVEFAIQRGGKALICDDMGLGKTIQGIAIAAYYMAEWPCLILAQASLKRVWSAEFEKWIPSIKNHIHVVESASDFKIAQITIMAYDLAAKMAETLSKTNFRVIVADESHMLKSVNAQRTQQLVPLLRKSKRSILLSGTPVLSRPSELFPQLLALDASIWPTMKGFGLRYCNAHDGLHGWDYSGNSNLIELNAILSHTVMIRRLKDAVLSDLPPKIRKIVQIEKDPSALLDPIDSDFHHNQSIIERISVLSNTEPSFETEIEPEITGTKPKKAKSSNASKGSLGNGEDDDILALYREASIVKQHGVSEYIRKLVEEEKPVRQSSFAPDHIDDPHWHTAGTKEKPNGRKFLIFAHHIPMLDAASNELRRLSVPFIRIDGSTSTKDRAAQVKQFQQDESVRAAVLSITCASTGLTLTASSLVIFAELYWNPGTLLQAEDRVHRLGQTAPFVELRYLFCKGTVDDLLWPLIGKKLGVIGSAINGAKEKMALNGDRSKITAINKKPTPKPKKPFSSSLTIESLDLDDDIVVIESDEEMKTPKKPKETKKRKSPSKPAGGKMDSNQGVKNQQQQQEEAHLETFQRKEDIPVSKNPITNYFSPFSSSLSYSSSIITQNAAVESSSSFMSVSPPLNDDPIVIEDSQESTTTPVYLVDKKRLHDDDNDKESLSKIHEPEAKRPKRNETSPPRVGHSGIHPVGPLATVPTSTNGRMLVSDRELKNSLPTETADAAIVKTTPWKKANLSFVSATPLRLGFK